jgi:hypothetical protein
MWDAGVYPLSVLIAVLSGAWPYLKLLLIGACWVCPPASETPQNHPPGLCVLDGS